MRRRFLLFLIFLSALTFVPTRASAAVDSFKFKGGTVFASFDTGDPNDECILISAGFGATEGRIKEGGGKPTTISYVNITLFRVNLCTGEVLTDVTGSATLADEAFVIDQQLNSATLNTTVEACDLVTGSCFPVTIDLTWTGTGEVTKQKSKFSSDFGNCKLHVVSKANTRSAVAEGSVTALGINFVPQPSDSAWVLDAQSGTAEVNCD